MNVATPPGPYPSDLLNEVHRYFPALLYDTGRFNDVPDVFDYVRNQMRQNFDLFTNARHEFLRTEGLSTPTRRVQQQQQPPTPRYVHQQYEARRVRMQNNQQQQQQQPPSQYVGGPNTSPLRNAMPLSENLPQTYPEDSDENAYLDGALTPLITNWLSSLLNTNMNTNPSVIYTTIPIPGWGGQPGNLFEPVAVRPSARALERGTTISVLEADAEGVCAVCQDSMNTGTTVRKINYCSHQFHRTCIDTWFQSHVRCPTCRHDIRDNVHVSTPSGDLNTNST